MKLEERTFGTPCKYGTVLVSYNSTDILVAFLARVSLLIKVLSGCNVYNLQFIESIAHFTGSAGYS